MSVDRKRVLAIGLLGIFCFVITMSFVSAVDNPIGDWFSSWENADFSANIAKYLFWALVSMAVFSVASNIPGLNKIFEGDREWLGMIFSVIIGFLSMAYITPDEVYAMMVSYSALGFTIGVALPFIILIAFTFTLATEDVKSVGQQLANKAIAWVMWGAFLIFLVYKSFATEIPDSFVVPNWILVIATALIFVSIGAIFGKMRKSKTQEVKDRAGETIDLAATLTKAQARSAEELANR